MLPYFEAPQLHLWGPFQLHPFGILVVTGIIAGTRWAKWQASKRNVSIDEITQAATWAVVVGLIVSHWVEILFYQPERLQSEGIWILLKIWDGISSFGGYFGGWLGSFIYLKSLKKDTLIHKELLTQAIIVGQVFGRMACSIAHDHPGRLTDFFLAFQFPGGARHDLGFYEFLWITLVMVPGLFWINHKKLPTGSSMVFACFTYAPARFFFDSLRAVDRAGSDLRYAGYTPAQYFCGILLIIGIVMLRYVIKNKPPYALEPSKA
ncbi:MAG: diacylglyceryl transferase [Bdellovibrionaceae bacterium]|nr:diacylglyceryl transferase [Pseudobdellovibrionaceae bacterium]|tara:strand:- start:5325 stop:6116 length:792 start_codon:yes stop_codon:yes gene_type:complete